MLLALAMALRRYCRAGAVTVVLVLMKAMSHVARLLLLLLLSRNVPSDGAARVVCSHANAPHAAPSLSVSVSATCTTGIATTLTRPQGSTTATALTRTTLTRTTLTRT